MAMISRFLKIISLLCKRNLYKSRDSRTETYNFKDPTNRSHPTPHDTSEENVHEVFLDKYRRLGVFYMFVQNIT